jgi:DNA-binding NarL/FixJ family response regulator
VVATFGDGLTTLNQLARFHPDILAIDSNLLDEEVDALLAAVKATQPDTRCLVLVRSLVRHDRLVANGADAVILRSGSAQDLKQALFRLVQGRAGNYS